MPAYFRPRSARTRYQAIEQAKRLRRRFGTETFDFIEEKIAEAGKNGNGALSKSWQRVARALNVIGRR